MEGFIYLNEFITDIMATTTIKNMSVDLLEHLKKIAKQEGRSLNAQQKRFLEESVYNYEISQQLIYERKMEISREVQEEMKAVSKDE